MIILEEVSDREYWDLLTRRRRKRVRPTFVKKLNNGNILKSKNLAWKSKKEREEDLCGYIKKRKFF